MAPPPPSPSPPPRQAAPRRLLSAAGAAAVAGAMGLVGLASAANAFSAAGGPPARAPPSAAVGPARGGLQAAPQASSGGGAAPQRLQRTLAQLPAASLLLGAAILLRRSGGSSSSRSSSSRVARGAAVPETGLEDVGEAEEDDPDPFDYRSRDVEEYTKDSQSMLNPDKGMVKAEYAIPGLPRVAPPVPKDQRPPFEPSNQIGNLPPLGFFDPLGYSKTGDKYTFRKYRVAEFKHGRVAMMANLGFLVQHYWHFPGFEKVPNGIWAPFTVEGATGLAVLTAICGALEKGPWKDNPFKRVGDFGDPLWFGFGVPTESGISGAKPLRVRELSNGRLAMFTAIGIMAAELVTGKDAIQQLGLP